jgi:hypothetical protein
VLHSEALLWVAAIPIVVALGLLAYVAISSMAQETPGLPSFMATTNKQACLLFAGISLSILLAGLIAYWLGTTSARPTFTGQVAHVRMVRVKGGWETKFFLQTDSGGGQRVSSWSYIRDLQDGDRVQVTLRAYDDRLETITVLSGKGAGYHLEMGDDSSRTLIMFMAFAVLLGVFAFLAGTGRIRDRKAKAGVGIATSA